MRSRISSSQRSEINRTHGSWGGLTRASRHDPEMLRAWSAAGGNATLRRYGRKHFVEIRKLRTQNKRRPSTAVYLAPHMVSARRNGSRGGIVTAETYDKKTRREWARLGGLATLARYGRDHFSKIRKLRKSYPKYKAGYTVREMKAWSKDNLQRSIAPKRGD